MNKKGFFRIIEAIVAIIIVLSFLMYAIPKIPRKQFTIPEQLDITYDALFQKLRENATYRNIILNPRGNSDGINSIKSFIEDTIPEPSPWQFAFEICPSSNQDDKKKCNCSSQLPNSKNCENFLPEDRSVYSKRLFIATKDVTTTPLSIGEKDTEMKIFTLYFWSKEKE